MYIPAGFREDRPDELPALIRAHPLGTLVTQGADGLQASPLPFLLRENRLCAHIARANPHWKSLDGQDGLAIFMGPDAYVTPDWYPSKAAAHEEFRARPWAPADAPDDFIAAQTRATAYHQGELLANWEHAQCFEPLERIQGADQDD